MTDLTSLSQQALNQSRLNLSALTEAEQSEILTGIQNRLSASQSQAPSGTTELFSVSFGCIACEVGLNTVLGAAIAAIIAAGVVIGPETIGIALIVRITGLGAQTVATILNGALGGGGAVTAEGIITELCQAMGTC
jgi:hypothetical protein